MKKDKLIKAIQKANPELMNLSFGCEVLDQTGVWKIIEYRKSNNEIVCWNKTGQDVLKLSKVTILGHPITLEHVLRAIEKKKTKGLISPMLKPRSEFWEFQKLIDIWQFGKPLSDQSQKLKDFLSEILL